MGPGRVYAEHPGDSAPKPGPRPWPGGGQVPRPAQAPPCGRFAGLRRSHLPGARRSSGHTRQVLVGQVTKITCLLPLPRSLGRKEGGPRGCLPAAWGGSGPGQLAWGPFLPLLRHLHQVGAGACPAPPALHMVPWGGGVSGRPLPPGSGTASRPPGEVTESLCPPWVSWSQSSQLSQHKPDPCL